MVLGYFLGHAHKGRQFQSNIHSNFAPWFLTVIIFQVSFGIFLKGHYNNPPFGKLRLFVVPVHSITGKLIPVLSYVQILFGGITVLGFCRSDHTGQCIAHFIMGSSFLGYGIVMTLMLVFGQEWLKRRGKSMDFYDSAVICIWGFVNTFTEHRWNEAWSHKDLQHTSLGMNLSMSVEGRNYLVDSRATGHVFIAAEWTKPDICAVVGDYTNWVGDEPTCAAP
ncbi:Protein YTP1 [Neolecta irregularis DAH-3]|uniref:Protein YTP1 n=1 Tax=Neolecta irregularis (strain DAH-3) TaxID=1198029 RepID=A0A1U7LL95_NEOID|nr:Protein YTP1 [Neolecta irregularis DAH-3]|eukprot:OLL23430.1 Protein YTP1 [Neolecta irregularis DAH-3]